MRPENKRSCGGYPDPILSTTNPFSGFLRELLGRNIHVDPSGNRDQCLKEGFGGRDATFLKPEIKNKATLPIVRNVGHRRYKAIRRTFVPI